MDDLKTVYARITAGRLTNTTIAFLLLAPIIIVSYVSYVFNPVHAENLFLYGMQLMADTISILTMMGLWITILMDVIVQDHHRIKTKPKKTLQEWSVDVLIPVAGEPIEIIEQTALAALAMDYPHNTFLLDDAKSLHVEELANSLGITYIVRNNRKHAKAGNLNNGLGFSKGEFFAIFDADQVPKKDFITKTLPYMGDSELSMVQTPQYFSNKEYFIAEGTSEGQEIFYKYVCPAKNISNSVFCVGTNVLFRRKAIEEIGGIAAVSHSEDIWTSRMLHENGWKTLFVNEILAIGKAPTTINAYFKQQLRWSQGGLSMLFLKNTMFSSNMHIDQKVQYFFTNFFYLVGFSILCYILFPILYLLFGLSPLRPETGLAWLFHYVLFFILYYCLTWLLIGRLSIATIATSAASFYPYLLALVTILFETKNEWVATTSKAKSVDIMRWIWPHVLIIILTAYSFVIGWYEPVDQWRTILYTFWAGWNMYLLMLFILKGSSPEISKLK